VFTLRHADYQKRIQSASTATTPIKLILRNFFLLRGRNISIISAYIIVSLLKNSRSLSLFYSKKSITQKSLVSLFWI